jgi:glycerophosphoryl diester phosphodiesterase
VEEPRKRSARAAIVVVVALVSLTVTVTASGGGSQTQGNDEKLAEPLVIGHRGASGYRPEHTLASFRLAIELGADYIEPDLVSTKDGVLVARHENEIGATTDVASHPEFAARQATKVIDGVSITGWFTEDFTLAELKSLKSKERIPALRATNAAFDGLEQIPTLQEVIDLARRTDVGIYPETKHPSYFDGIGLSLEEPLVATLSRNGYTRRSSPVFIQSFEVSNLKELSGMTKVPLVQLISDVGKPYDFVLSGDPRTYADLATRAGLREIARYADGVGPNKNLIVPRDSANRLLSPTSFVRDAHRWGLAVHPWTFRRENSFLPEDFRAGNPVSPVYQAATGDFQAELRLFYRLGVDGVFTDNPDVAVAARSALDGVPQED